MHTTETREIDFSKRRDLCAFWVRGFLLDGLQRLGGLHEVAPLVDHLPLAEQLEKAVRVWVPLLRMGMQREQGTEGAPEAFARVAAGLLEAPEVLGVELPGGARARGDLLDGLFLGVLDREGRDLYGQPLGVLLDWLRALVAEVEGASPGATAAQQEGTGWDGSASGEDSPAPSFTELYAEDLEEEDREYLRKLSDPLFYEIERERLRREARERRQQRAEG